MHAIAVFLLRPVARYLFSLLTCMGFLATGFFARATDTGERFSYRVSWGIFTNAGFIEINSRLKKSEAGPRLHVTTTTATRGFIRGLYAFDGKSESVFDATGIRLFSVVADSGTRNERDTYAMTLDYDRATAHFTNSNQPGKHEVVALPEGDPIDLAMCLIQARLWKMVPGDKRDIVVLFGSDFYDLTVTAERYEQVKTPLGTYWTLLLVPRMEKTEPKGMFKKGSAVRVWISQDENPLPVKFELQLKVGTGVASLIDYEAPAYEENPRS